jgi:hypothetical protein
MAANSCKMQPNTFFRSMNDKQNVYIDVYIEGTNVLSVALCRHETFLLSKNVLLESVQKSIGVDLRVYLLDCVAEGISFLIDQ